MKTKEKQYFTSTHNLTFEVAPWEFDIGDRFERFRIGTCGGLWRCKDNEYQILAIDNKEKGNGHLEDVFDWFINSCKRDKKSLVILELWNRRFKKHLMEKRGFKQYHINDLILNF